MSLKEELERDRAEFKKLGVKEPIIFGTSKKGGFDNEKLILHIISWFVWKIAHADKLL